MNMEMTKVVQGHTKILSHQNIVQKNMTLVFQSNYTEDADRAMKQLQTNVLYILRLIAQTDCLQKH